MLSDDLHRAFPDGMAGVQQSKSKSPRQAGSFGPDRENLRYRKCCISRINRRDLPDGEGERSDTAQTILRRKWPSIVVRDTSDWE